MAYFEARPLPKTSGGGISGAATGAIAMGAASALTNIFTGIIGAHSTKRAGEFNARMFEFEGRINAIKQRQRKLSAKVEVKRIRREGMAIYGTQRATYAASGVRLSGSPVAVMKESLKQAELDIIYTNINAEYGDVDTTRVSAGMERLKGSQAGSQAITDAGSSLLKFGTSLYTILDKEGRK